MANRFPLVLDTADGNKIKEIQTGDNLYLADNSITGVQNITALGTIDAAQIKVAGNLLVAQQFANLTDTPATYTGSENQFVKVNAAGTGIEYRSLSDLGNIQIATITVDTSIIPSADNTGVLGTSARKLSEVYATTLKGNLAAFDGTIVFNATTGKVSYAALQGYPTQLSEFTNDVGYLRSADLNTTLAGLFDEGQVFSTDIKGSVFGDDSTMLLDGISSKIVGDVINSNVTTSAITSTTAQITTTTATTINGPSSGNLAIDAGTSGIVNIGFGAATTAVNINDAVIETFAQGSGLGVAQLSANTDISITAGNRVKIEGGVPFKFASITTTSQLSIGAQEGDVIYNTTANRLQMYQGSAWKDINGNVEATAGTSNFNNVVIAGDLTITGDATEIQTTNTAITDNVIVLNKGEAGAGVTLSTAGIQIDRGSLPDKNFAWDEGTDKWTIGSETFVADRVESTVLTDNTISITGGNLTGATQISATTFVGAVTGNLTGNAAGAHTGTFDGDMTGSVFADTSTLLVDGVNGVIPAANLLGTATITVIGNVTGNVVGSLTGNADTVTNGVYTIGDQTIAGAKTFSSTIIGSLQGNVTGNITGNIDQATLAIGATTATVIGIGNVNSTTTINGTLASPAVISGSITADDSMSITTATGNGNAISIGPAGTNTFVNLTADSIRFFGPVTTSIVATGGITGDIKGSVVADDSSVMIDGLTGTIVGPVSSTIITGTTITASTKLLTSTIENSGSDLNVNIDGFVNIFAGYDDGTGLSKLQLDKEGTSYMELATEPKVPGNAADTATISINAGAASGNVIIGTVTSTRNQVVTIHNATVSGTLAGSVAGTLDGDVTGSVFGDDSSTLVDGVAGKIVGPISTIKADMQQISGPGAIDVTSLITEITTTGTDAYSLANGVLGQLKIILAADVSGGTGTVTPTTVQGGTTLTFDAVGESITLIYTSLGWMRTAGAAGVLA